MKRGLAALERLRDSAREGLGRTALGRTAVAYAVLVVALLLTGLASYNVSARTPRQNAEARERERFEEIVGSTERAVDRRMQTYVDAMLDGMGLFVAEHAHAVVADRADADAVEAIGDLSVAQT